MFSSGFYPLHSVGTAAPHKMAGRCLLLSLGRCGFQPFVQCTYQLKHLVTLQALQIGLLCDIFIILFLKLCF